MIGVLLAAGEASRLPNKALLPTREGDQIICESGLQFLRRAQVSRTVVVVRKDSLLPKVLRCRGWKNLQYITQGPLPGVMGAIAAVDREDKSMLITFCDNVYDPRESAGPYVGGDSLCASVRDVPGDHLDWYGAGSWRTRGFTAATQTLAGWVYVPPGDFDFEWSGLIPFLNFYNASPVFIPPNLMWHDIGTPESYERYLDGRL